MKQRIHADNQEDFEQIATAIFEKYKRGNKISSFEIDFFCTATHPNVRHLYSICDEYRFRDYYFRNLKYRPLPEGFELTTQEKSYLDYMAEDWQTNVVKVTNHSSQTLQFVAKETRKELKLMEKEFRYNGYLVRSFLYKAKLQRLLWMSRFIHFKIVYDFFLGYDPRIIAMQTIFGEVIFDDQSLSHILFRHYAAGEKQYQPDQSFFSGDVTINSLPRLAYLVLARIAKAKINIIQPLNKAISFKYKKEYYHLYLNDAVIQRKGIKGNISITRIQSLYPINEQYIIDGISTLKSHVVSRHLTIYEQ